MKQDRDSLFSVGLYLVIIGFINFSNHHNLNYIERTFYWLSIGGEPVKLTVYNLMIPKRIRCFTQLKMSFFFKIVKKEFINIFFLDFELCNRLKKLYLSDLVEGVKKYVLSLWSRDDWPKKLSKMDAFGVKKLRKI